MVKSIKFTDNIKNKAGQAVQGIKFYSERNEESMTVDDIARIFKDVVEGLKGEDFDGKIQLTLKDPETGQFKTVFKFTDINEITELVIDDQLEDYWGKLALRMEGEEILGEYREFYIKMLQNVPMEEEFGKDKFNDCLYNCLCEVAEKETKKVFPTPESLKSYLGIPRYGKTNMDHVKKVDENIKGIKIRILGDDTYVSVKEDIKEVTLELCDGHLTVYEKSLNYCPGVSVKDKPYAVYKFGNDNTKVDIYNGRRKFSISMEKFRKWQKNIRYSSPYVLVPSYEKTLETAFFDFGVDASFVECLTDGEFDLYRTGSVKKCILAKFYELNQTLKADPIDQDEAKWLNGCFMNGLIWAKKGYKGKAHKQDVVSCYPSIMRQQKFGFPVKRGKFKCLTNEEFNNLKYFPYGIFRINIHNYDIKLLRIKGEYATHFDVQRAKELGYKMELVQDGKPNFLDYSGANMRADGRIFKEMIDKLFEAKRLYGKDFPLLKKLLNYLWGLLCQRKIYKKYVPKEGEGYQLGNNEELSEVIDRENFLIAKILDKKEPFSTPFARLGPFLLARGRCLMSRLIEQNYDDVVRVYVDGIITTKKLNLTKVDNRRLENLGMGEDIGCLKYEGYNEHIEIHPTSGKVIGLYDFI